MVAILYPRRLPGLLDVTQPQGTGLPDQGIPVLYSSNSSFVIETHGGGGAGSFSAGVSTLGNTLGDTGVTGSRVVLAGIGNLTLSQATDANGGTISISAGTAAAGGATISASDQLFSSGTVVLTGVGGGVTVNTQAANTIRISVAAPVAQTVQTQNLHDVTIDGNTAGAGALISSGTMTLAGGSNITLSQNGNAISIIGNAAGTESQTAISGIAASNTTYTSGTVNIVGSGIVTVQSGTGQRVIVNASQSVQPETQTFIGGIVGSNATYTSGTVTITGVGGGVTVSSNTGQRIDISVAAPVAQTGTQFSAGISGGNTSGNSGTVAGRVVFAGGNNITLSGSTNGASETITISAFTQSAESQSIGMSNIGNTSGTTGIASGAQVRMLFAGGNNVTLSQSLNGASGTLTISAASQTVQTQNMVAVTLSGNTSGALAGISSGTMTIAGGNNITVSQAGNAFTISGPNVGGAQTGISALANSETTYTSGSVTFSALGALTIRSTTGQQFQFSVNSQSVQPETQTFVGGIANSQTTYTSGTVGLSELGAVTIRSTTGNQFQISVNSQSVQTQSLFSAGVSTGGNTAGDTGVTGTRLVFVGSNNITLSQATAAAGGTITISGPTTAAQTGTQFSGGISGGNTSGDTGTVAGRLVFAGGNNITLSGSTNGVSETITISAGAAGGFSGGVSNVGNTSGDTGITGSRLVLAGTNGITLSQSTNASGGTVTISGITQSVESQSIGMSNLGNTSGTTGIASGGQVRFLFAGGNNITLSQSLNGASGTLTISAPNAQTGISGIANSQTTYTSGTVSLSELGAITIRSTTGNQYQFSVNAQTAQTGISGIANSQTTYTSGTVSMSELGAITIRSTTGNQYQFSVAAQTVESQSIGASNLGNTLGTSGVASGGQVRAVIIGTSNITVSQSVNGASATLSLIGQPAFSAGMSNIGNTSGDTGITATRLVLAGGNNITLSQSTNASGGTVTISAPNLGAGAMSVGVSTGGNTAGATGITGTQMVFVGTNNITLSQTTGANGGTISISGAPSFSAGVSTGGNTAGATGVSGTQMVLVGSSPISLSQTTGANGNTITINAPATSSLSGVSNVVISTNGSTISIGYRDPLADWENMPRQQASLISHVSGFSKTPIYWNDHIDGQLTAKSFAFAISMVTATQPLSLSAHLGIYTLVNSTSANLLGSVSEAYVVSSASSVSLSGVRNLIMTGIGTHTALSVITAGEYVVGMMFSATATNAMNFSLVGATGGAGPLGGIYPGTNQLTTGTSQGIQPLAGRGSTTVNAMPAAVSQADLVNQGTAASQPLHPWIYIRS